MAETNEKLEIRRKDLADIDFSGLLAYSAGCFGASMLMQDGTLYHVDYYNGDIRPEELGPLLQKAELHGFAVLGMGNVLHFREDDTDWLFEKWDRYAAASDALSCKNLSDRRAALYQNWVAFFREHMAESAGEKEFAAAGKKPGGKP